MVVELAHLHKEWKLQEINQRFIPHGAGVKFCLVYEMLKVNVIFLS